MTAVWGCVGLPHHLTALCMAALPGPPVPQVFQEAEEGQPGMPAYSVAVRAFHLCCACRAVCMGRDAEAAGRIGRARRRRALALARAARPCTFAHLPRMFCRCRRRTWRSWLGCQHLILSRSTLRAQRARWVWRFFWLACGHGAGARLGRALQLSRRICCGRLALHPGATSRAPHLLRSLGICAGVCARPRRELDHEGTCGQPRAARLLRM